MRTLLIFSLFTLAVSRYDDVVCAGDKCQLKERTVGTCTLTCNEYMKGCNCDENNSTTLGCFLFDRVLSPDDDVCTDRKPKDFLYLGQCVDTPVFCNEYTEHDYHWCPFILRLICNFHRHVWNFLTCNTWRLEPLSYKYYVHKTPYGDKVAVKEFQTNNTLVECNIGCYTNPVSDSKFYQEYPDKQLDSLLEEYVPQGTQEDEETLSYIEDRLEQIEQQQYISQRELEHKRKRYKLLLTMQVKQQKRSPRRSYQSHSSRDDSDWEY